jgi:elongation factor G
MARGVISGHPVVDVQATLYDGKFHEVDSSEAAFRQAGILAFQNAVTNAHPALLEPVMSVTITIPEEVMGDVIGDLNSRRGRVLSLERADEDGVALQRIQAQIPQREMLTYAIDLRSLARGRGSFHAEVSHYEEAPNTVQREVIQEARDAGFSAIA